MLLIFFSKYGWIDPLKDKKGTTITNALQKMLGKSRLNQRKHGLIKAVSEFYNRSMKFWLQNNNGEIYSTHNERKSVVAGRFIRTLKTKIYK